MNVVWKTITLAQDLTYPESSRSNRIRLGMERARKRGVKLGRPRLRINLKRLKKLAAQKSLREIAGQLGCSKSCVQIRLAKAS
jgi:DNA invertase Pin-like site-specific DNA recombinase